MDILYQVIKALALPPGLHALAGLLALLLYPRWRRLALSLLAAVVVSLWWLATPTAAAWLARPLETLPPFEPAQLAGRPAEAIVVLGGGATQRAREYHGADEASPLTLERLRHAARLQRLTGLPLVVTGGLTGGLATAEGEIMARSLETDFGIAVPHVEAASRNTAENASLTAAAVPYRRILLVTHAVHMPRALRAFTDAGFDVVPAPLGYIDRSSGAATLHDWLPAEKYFAQSQYAIYERLGALWYWLRTLLAAA